MKVKNIAEVLIIFTPIWGFPTAIASYHVKGIKGERNNVAIKERCASYNLIGDLLQIHLM